MVWVTNKAQDSPRSSSSRNKWLSVAASWGLQISLCQVYRSVYVKCLFTKAKQKSQSRQTKSVGNTLSQASLGSTYNRREKASESSAQETTLGLPNLKTHTVSQGRKEESLQDPVQVPAGAPGFHWTVAPKGVEDVAVHVWTGWGFLQILHPSHPGAFPDPQCYLTLTV